jgi:hypothetical protein
MAHVTKMTSTLPHQHSDSSRVDSNTKVASELVFAEFVLFITYEFVYL